MGRFVTTVLLVVVLAGLGAYIYFVDSERPAGGAETKDKVFTVDATAIEELTVTNAGESTTLRKQDGVWKITAPIAADADTSEVSGVTSAIAGLEVNRVVDENAANLADYGLADPRIRLAYKAAGGGSGELLLGEKSPTQSDVYAVRPTDTRVFLVPAYHESALAKKTFDLRDKRVLQFERDKVDSIELTGAGLATKQPTTLHLAKVGSDWVVKQPATVRAEFSEVEGLLTRLSTAAMTGLVDTAAPLALDLDTPTTVVKVCAGSSCASLDLGSERDGTLYAQDRSRQMVFTVDPSLAKDLQKTLADVRDKDLFEFRTFNVARLTFTRGTETYDFQKASGDAGADKWQRLVDGKATDVDATKMEDLISKASSLRAQSFEDTPTARNTTLVVSASYDNGKFERVHVSKTDEGAWARRDGEPGSAVLDTTAYEDILKALDELLK